MPNVQIPLIKGDKIGIETDYRDALPINKYAVPRKILGTEGYMSDFSGLTELGTGKGNDRGAIYNERFDEQYRVSGDKLISVSSNGTVTELGSIPGSSQARLIDFYSFNTQGIIADNKFFLYDSGSGLREVTDSDLGNPIDGVWVDGYYFMTDGESLFHTQLSDETSIDPLDYGSAEFMPDPILGLSKTQDNKVMVWGRYTLEYFVNDETSAFAFSRVQTRAQKIGIVATHAKCETNKNFYITGGYRDTAVGVYIVNLGDAKKVSTREIDKILSEYSENDLSDMRMESRTEDDITFVLIHLPSETLCFNETVAAVLGNTVAWSILKSGITGESNYRAINGVFDARSSKWVFGDKRGPIIGYLDREVATHYNNLTENILFTPLIDLETFSIDQISIENISGQSSVDDAKVAISLTYDGITYGKEWWATYGEPHNYNQRFIVNRLGYCGEWVGFKFRTVSTTKMTFALMKLVFS